MKPSPTHNQGSVLFETIIALTLNLMIIGILYLVSVSHIRTRTHIETQLLFTEHTWYLHHLIKSLLPCHPMASSTQRFRYQCPSNREGVLYVDSEQCALFERLDSDSRAHRRLSHICNWSVQQDTHLLTIKPTLCTDAGTCIHPTLRFIPYI
jgi:hypothetical protein